MKEEINLLSPLAKQARQHRLYARRLSHILTRMAFILLIFIGALVAINIVERRLQKSVAAQLNSYRTADEILFRQIEMVNKTVAEIDRHSVEHPAKILYARHVTQVLPAEMRLTLLEWSEENQTLVVQGITASRPAIAEFQRRLSELSWVEKVDAPLRNFAGGSEGTFSFTLYRKSAL